MFVGHGLVAFALVALGADRLGYDARRALTVGVLAGLFATVPDLDILYALTGLTGATGPFAAANAFWASSTVVHRTVTHSLVVAAVVGLAGACWRLDRPAAKAIGLATMAAVAGVVGLDAGTLGLVVVVPFVLAVLVLASLAARQRVSPTATAAAALVGLLSHPFGDLLTGQPPALLYPLDVTVVAERIALHPDPTLHLLGAFWVELATVWLAAVVWLHLTGRRPRAALRPRAVVGLSYAATVLFLPAPTLETSYHFVFSVLAVGGAAGVSPRRSSLSVDTVAVTGLATVTLASLAYAVAYAMV